MTRISRWLPVTLAGTVALFTMGCAGGRADSRSPDYQPLYIPTASTNSPSTNQLGTNPGSTNEPPKIVVSERPPPPQIEAVGRPPAPAYVWIPGFWEWRRHWEWKPGHWAAKPRPGSIWIPGRWTREANGWAWMPGYWQ